MYTVSEIARHISRSTPSVRRLTADLAGFLSPGANPLKGHARRYSDQDLQVLAYAVSRLDEGATVAQVLEELPGAELPALEDILPQPAPEPEPETAITPGDFLAQLAASQVATAKAIPQIADAIRQIAAGQRQAPQDLGQVLARLDDLAQEVEALSQDLAALSQRIAVLERRPRGLRALLKPDRE